MQTKGATPIYLTPKNIKFDTRIPTLSEADRNFLNDILYTGNKVCMQPPVSVAKTIVPPAVSEAIEEIKDWQKQNPVTTNTAIELNELKHERKELRKVLRQLVCDSMVYNANKWELYEHRSGTAITRYKCTYKNMTLLAEKYAAIFNFYKCSMEMDDFNVKFGLPLFSKLRKAVKTVIKTVHENTKANELKYINEKLYQAIEVVENTGAGTKETVFKKYCLGQEI